MRMRRPLIVATLALGLSGSFTAVAAARLTNGGRPKDGLYAEKGNPKLPYSNGGVDLQVGSGGRKIVPRSGVACYTGSDPAAGLPAYDEVQITIPRALPVKADKSFSFSGPVTLTPEEAGTEEPVTTTYTIKGRFVGLPHGGFKIVGTDSSPICQPSTEKHFTLTFDPAES